MQSTPVAEGAIFGLGNPLLDISAEVPTSLLEEYGLKPSDAILAEEKHAPLYQHLIDNYPVEYIAGGSTQNSIRIAQWMLQDTPKATTYVGCIGKDDYGAQLSKVASAAGVRTHYMVDSTAETGTCAVLVTHPERSLCTKLAAANNYKISHLESEETQALVKKADIFFIAGFFLTVSVDSAESIGKYAAQENKVLAMSLAAPFIIDFFTDQVKTLIPYMDYVFANEHEAVSFGKKFGTGESLRDIVQIALALAAMPKVNKARPRVVVFTQGPLPVIVATEGKVYQYPIIPCKPENIVDLNGAGDAFVGGFLATLAKGGDLDKCMEAGKYCSNVVIQRSGATVPDKPDFQG